MGGSQIFTQRLEGIPNIPEDVAETHIQNALTLIGVKDRKNESEFERALTGGLHKKLNGPLHLWARLIRNSINESAKAAIIRGGVVPDIIRTITQIHEITDLILKRHEVYSFKTHHDILAHGEFPQETGNELITLEKCILMRSGLQRRIIDASKLTSTQNQPNRLLEILPDPTSTVTDSILATFRTSLPLQNLNLGWRYIGKTLQDFINEGRKDFKKLRQVEGSTRRYFQIAQYLREKAKSEALGKILPKDHQNKGHIILLTEVIGKGNIKKGAEPIFDAREESRFDEPLKFGKVPKGKKYEHQTNLFKNEDRDAPEGIIDNFAGWVLEQIIAEISGQTKETFRGDQPGLRPAISYGIKPSNLISF